MTAAFDYVGPDTLRAPITAALQRVVDPELALSIVDVGLIYGVTVDDTALQLRLTMTSPACPVADVIVDDIGLELERVVPAALRVEVELVWEPPWSSDRMSERAKRFMGW